MSQNIIEYFFYITMYCSVIVFDTEIKNMLAWGCASFSVISAGSRIVQNWHSLNIDTNTIITSS